VAFLSVWFARGPVGDNPYIAGLNKAWWVLSASSPKRILYILVGGVHLYMLVYRRVLQNVDK